MARSTESDRSPVRTFRRIIPMVACAGLFVASGLPAYGKDEATSGKPIPADLRLIERGPCDARNRRLYLENQHSSRTFSVTVRWSAAGGKELTEKVLVGPNEMLELGCAASAKILEATPADF